MLGSKGVKPSGYWRCAMLKKIALLSAIVIHQDHKGCRHILHCFLLDGFSTNIDNCL